MKIWSRCGIGSLAWGSPDNDIRRWGARAYAEASPEEQAALRAWMRDIVLPRKVGRNDIAKSRRSEKDSIAPRDQRILEFPLSKSPRAVAKMLKAEGWRQNHVYYIEFQVRRFGEKVSRETSGQQTIICPD
jgi:hypothetical protein